MFDTRCMDRLRAVVPKRTIAMRTLKTFFAVMAVAAQDRWEALIPGSDLLESMVANAFQHRGFSEMITEDLARPEIASMPPARRPQITVMHLPRLN
jgi:hypothetical protein